MLVFHEKDTELSLWEWDLLPSLPPKKEIPGVQCRDLSSKCLLSPRLGRNASGMGARQLGARTECSPRDARSWEGRGPSLAIRRLSTCSAAFLPFATVLLLDSAEG